MLNSSPSFTNMNSRVSGLQEAATEHKLAIDKISMQQSTDSSTLSEILSAVKGGSRDTVGGDRPAAAPQRKEDRAAKTVELAAHMRFCDKMSVSINREFLKFDEFEKDEKQPVPFKRWSSGVMRCKSLNQWISKISSVYGDEAASDIKSQNDGLEAILSKDPDVLLP